MGRVIKSIGHFRVSCQNAPWIVLGTLSLLSLAITLPRKLGQKSSPKQFHSAVRHKTDQVLISPPKWPMTCRPRSRRKKGDSCFFGERRITCRQNWFIISCSSFQVQIHLKTMKVYIHVTIANDFLLKDETMLRTRLPVALKTLGDDSWKNSEICRKFYNMWNTNFMKVFMEFLKSQLSCQLNLRRFLKHHAVKISAHFSTFNSSYFFGSQISVS